MRRISKGKKTFFSLFVELDGDLVIVEAVAAVVEVAVAMVLAVLLVATAFIVR